MEWPKFLAIMAYAVAILAITGLANYFSRRTVNKWKAIAEEDAPPPAFDMPEMAELKRNPDTIERLRGKVVSVAYNPSVSLEMRGRTAIQIEESFLVDVNGAVQTIEKGASVAGTTGVEDNARWLAEVLEVEFES